MAYVDLIVPLTFTVMAVAAVQRSRGIGRDWKAWFGLALGAVCAAVVWLPALWAKSLSMALIMPTATAFMAIIGAFILAPAAREAMEKLISHDDKDSLHDVQPK